MRTTKRTIAGFLAAAMTAMTVGTMTVSAAHVEYKISDTNWSAFIANGAGSPEDLNADVVRTSDEAHSGKYSAYSSAAFVLAGNTWIDIQYDIPKEVLKPNTTYSIKYWVKANCGGIHRLKTTYGGNDGGHVDEGLVWYTGFDWTQQTKTFTTGDTVLSHLRLRFRSEGYETAWHGPEPAEMWIDDISVHEVVDGVESATNLVADYNCGIENEIDSAVSGVDAFAESDSVTLYWNETPVESFDVNVYVKDGDALNLLGTVASGVKTYKASGLDANKEYSFVLKSISNGMEAEGIECKAFTNSEYNSASPDGWGIFKSGLQPRARVRIAPGYEGAGLVMETIFPTHDAFHGNSYFNAETNVNWTNGKTYTISMKVKHTGIRFAHFFIGDSHKGSFTWEGGDNGGDWRDVSWEYTADFSGNRPIKAQIVGTYDDIAHLYIDNVKVVANDNPDVNLVSNGDMETYTIAPKLYKDGAEADVSNLSAGTYDMVAKADLTAETNTLTAVIYNKNTTQVEKVFKETFDVSFDDEYVLQNVVIDEGEYGAFLFACTHDEDNCTCGTIEKEDAALSDVTYTSAGNNAKLTWVKTKDGSYSTNVYLKDGETLTKLGSTTGTEFEATNLLANKEYTFVLATTDRGIESNGLEVKAFTAANTNVLPAGDNWQFVASNQPYARMGIAEGYTGQVIVVEAKYPFEGNAFPPHTFVSFQMNNVQLISGHEYVVIYKYKNENVWNAQISVEGAEQTCILWGQENDGAGWLETEKTFKANRNGSFQFQILTTATNGEIGKFYIDDLEIYDNTVDPGVDLVKNGTFDNYNAAPVFFEVNADGSAAATAELFGGTFRVAAPAIANGAKNTLITAVYDKTNGGQLVELFSEDYDVSGSLSQILTYDFTFTPEDETHLYEARAFVWNSLGGLTPVTNVASIESIY